MAKTKKEILSMLDGQRVKREYINIPTVNDIDGMREALKRDIIKNGDDVSILEEDEKTFSFKGYNNFIWKPRCKNGIGIFKARSKDYVFTLDGEEASYGNIPTGENFQALENGFINITERLKDNTFRGIKYTLV